MSSTTTNKFPARPMARCPNCDHAIDQLGTRTNCGKCGKQLTIQCINCQTNNPPVFQFCLKCSADFRVCAVQEFQRQLSLVTAQLSTYQELCGLRSRAAALQRLSLLGLCAGAAIIGLLACYRLPAAVSLMLALIISFAGYLINRVGGQWLAGKLVGLPGQSQAEWQRAETSARKQQAQRLELAEQLAYYENELAQFRLNNDRPPANQSSK